MNKTQIILLSVLTFFLLSYKINQPFWGHHEFNGVYYGMIAKNFLRYGIFETRGAQVTNLFPTPPNQWDFHANHPSTYPLILTAFFSLFGAVEPTARMVSIISSILGIVILGKLVSVVFPIKNTWLASLVVVFSPLFLYYGSLPVFEPILFPIITFGFLKYWQAKRDSDLKWVGLSILIAVLVDWPGFWLPLWLFVIELVSKRRKKMLLTVLNSTMLAVLILAAHYITAYGSLDQLIKVGLFRSGVSGQPYTLLSWIRLLISRTRAFWGDFILLTASIGFIASFFRNSKRTLVFLLAALGLGISHIFVFRNITWYHDYMLYHTLPFVGLAMGSFYYEISKKTKSRSILFFITFLILAGNILSTNRFFIDLARMDGHKDCIEMGRQVGQSQEKLTFTLSYEKAKECPAFIGFYGEKPFVVESLD